MGLYRLLAICCWLPLLLAGCGGSGEPPRLAAARGTDAVALITPSAGAPGIGRSSQPLAQDRNQPPAPAGQSRLSALNALPLLAQLTAREKNALLEQLPGASASRRLALINSYPQLASLPELQKEVLLNQLEKIVPPAAAQSMLVCECGGAIKREICTNESCTASAELASLCNKACGTLAAFGNRCSVSPACRR